MASTPPAQIWAEAHTPPTPLHGSAYHSKSSPSRYHTRSNTRHQILPSFTESPHSPHSPPSTRTPRSLQTTNLHSEDLHVTPRRTSRRVQVFSPASPNSDTVAPSLTYQQNSSYLSATAVISEGMLPTPQKTPQKKPIAKSATAARALFQDQPSNAMFQSPRKSQKNKKVRHNGFSLESFSENTSQQDAITIHVDSQDQVPMVDPSEDNPFYTAPATKSHSKKRSAPSSSSTAEKMTATSKRRKVGREERKSLDPQVEEAIEKDEGMVYVFRGKKVYRRFEDAGDEEEVIDPEELGLLQHSYNGRAIVQGPLKTLTRKSIKPRRLFVEDIQQPKVTQSDEEADTEIDDEDVNTEESVQASPSRATRSRAKIISQSSGGSRKGSPFDAWPRLKSGSARSVSGGGSVPASKGRKRTAAEALEV